MLKEKNSKIKNRIIRLTALATFIIFSVLVLSATTFGWLWDYRKVGSITQINKPAPLSILSADEMPLYSINITNIAVEDPSVTTAQYLFCVYGNTVWDSYDVELACTTNIPFEYSLYRALKTNAVDGVYIEPYLDYTREEQYCYYYDPTPLTLNVLNLDEGNLANRDDGFYDSTYKDIPESLVQNNAIPLYMIATIESPRNSIDIGFAEYFVLEINWENVDKADIGKEVDIIYILAQIIA